MTILCHRQQLIFVNHGTDDKAGDGQQIVVSPRPGQQTVPEWVRTTETFKQASKSGLVVEIRVVSEETVAEVVEVKEKHEDGDGDGDLAGLSAAGSSGKQRGRRG